MRTRARRPLGTFGLVWAGQAISLIGSNVTSFAIGLWVFQRTGSVTPFALITLATLLPSMLLSPIAGSLADRADRRLVMIGADTGAALGTLAMVLLLQTGHLQMWEVYLAAAMGAACGAFRWPAFTAATSLLVEPKDLGRAGGMMQLGRGAAQILAPALAGALIGRIQLSGLIVIDLSTYVVAIVPLLLVRFPRPTNPPGTREPLLRDMTYGWRYLRTQPGLLAMLGFLSITNFLWGLLGVTITPMILGFTSATVLGLIVATAGGGVLVGSAIMSVWGGPIPRILGVLNFELLSGFCFMIMGLRPSAVLVALGAFGAHLTIAIIDGSNLAIWQSKVPPAEQGRILSTQQMFAQSATPIAYLVGGFLADRVFSPLLLEHAPLARSLGPILGTGASRGLGLLFVVMGLVKIAVSLSGYLYPPLRRVEDGPSHTVRASV